MKGIHSYLEQIVGELAGVFARVDQETLSAFLTYLLGARRIFVAGVGRSGLIMRGFAMRLMHLGCQVYVVGDVTTPAILPGDLLLVGSGSGATASLLAHGQRAKAEGAALVLITTQPHSPLAQHADLILHIPAPTPKAAPEKAAASIQPMASLFEQSTLILLDALSIRLMQELGIDDETAFTRHANLE